MKRLAMLVAAASMMACGGPKMECSDSTAIPGCGNLQACSDGVNSHYEYNGKEYDCNGTDCTSAATTITSLCIGNYGGGGGGGGGGGSTYGKNICTYYPDGSGRYVYCDAPHACVQSGNCSSPQYGYCCTP